MNVKNTAIEKQEEASNFLKDNHLNLTISKDSDIRLMSMYKKINVAVIGATGYTGLDLVYILSKHPKINIKNLCATKNLGKKIKEKSPPFWGNMINIIFKKIQRGA